ncbi:MAG: hypothetical protein OEV72_03580 [Thermoleophilia bacterium]|nr:hypothetical protein [Thermoleophilia bacterium]
MSEQQYEPDPLDELRDVAAAAEKLAADEEAFVEAFDAFTAADAARFQAALDRVGLAERCELVCVYFCTKRCVGTCARLCPERATRPVDAKEVLEFTHAIARVAKDRRALERLVKIAEAEDVRAWQAELKKLELTRFCHQVCRFLCRVRCKRHCRHLCARPLITRISSIPTAQFDAQGFGSGPSVPPFQVPPPSPATGVGDHPIGASSWLMGVFNFATATQYKVEHAPSPAGPWTPIAEPVAGYASMFPLIPVTRFPSGGADPGWYDISAIPLSDGGPATAGEKTLVYWTTPTDGLYWLRLRVRDGAAEKVSAPRAVRVDNTAPPTPVITLELKTPAGELKPLKCGKVKRGDGLIRITVEAHDDNFSRLSVAAQGNSSLSVPIVAVPEGTPGPAVPLSKTYNGNVADTGYPVPTSFLWDPWSDPRIIPCCYVARIDIWDRAVLNNAWAGGHGRSGWEAIEIGF